MNPCPGVCQDDDNHHSRGVLCHLWKYSGFTDSCYIFVQDLQRSNLDKYPPGFACEDYKW